MTNRGLVADFKKDMKMLWESRTRKKLAKFITILSTNENRLTIDDADVIIDWVSESN
jgi:hypothetical protein